MKLVNAVGGCDLGREMCGVRLVRRDVGGERYE